MSNDDRIEILGREVIRARRGLRLLMVGVGLVIGAFALGHTVTAMGGAANGGADTNVRAGMFYVVDEKGRPRITLGMIGDAPILAFYDEQGRSRAELRLTENEPQLTLRGRDEKRIVSLTVFDNRPTVALSDEKGVLRVQLRVVTEDGAALRLTDADGKVRAGIGVMEGGEGVVFPQR